MPVPVEYNPLRRMSTITVPKQDIQFDPYDFQLCRPQTDIKDTFESRELEASFCRDFACCGLVLDDLHDLLQHYEECHVRLEDDDGASLFDETDTWSSTGMLSPQSQLDDDPLEPISPMLSEPPATTSLPTLDTLKIKAAAYLTDLYNTSNGVSADAAAAVAAAAAFLPSSSTAPPTPISPAFEYPETIISTNISATTAPVSRKSASKKRSHAQVSNIPSALDLLSQSAVKKLALAAGDLPTPVLSDEEFLAQAGALLATATTNVNADKPYKCPVQGCDKAYKNPNGLKYHNQHGHCNLVAGDPDGAIAKPYQCTIGECGKRYKNLNGLKYHIEHSHMAALNHTLATFGSSFFLKSVSSASTPVPSPCPSPTMSAASLPSAF